MGKIILTFGFVLFAFNSVFGQEHYYWAYGEKYSLEILPNKQFLLLDNEQKKNELVQGLGVAQNKVADITTTRIAKTIEKSATISSLDKFNWTIVIGDMSKKRLEQGDEVLYSVPFFQINGKELGLSNLFYVKLKKQSDFKLLKEMAEKSNVHILGSDKSMPL